MSEAWAVEGMDTPFGNYTLDSFTLQPARKNSEKGFYLKFNTFELCIEK